MDDKDVDPVAFLKRRRAEKVSELKELEELLEKARLILHSLDVAIAAFGENGPSHSDSPRLTIKQGVLKVLEKVAPEGLTALSILERLRVDLGMDYPRTSLSPQLSRLKTEGKVRLQGGVWYLK
jgi:hypothetical protein